MVTQSISSQYQTCMCMFNNDSNHTHQSAPVFGAKSRLHSLRLSACHMGGYIYEPRLVGVPKRQKTFQYVLTLWCPSRSSLWTIWQNFHATTGFSWVGSRRATLQNSSALLSWWEPIIITWQQVKSYTQHQTAEKQYRLTLAVSKW